jgi:hypothetical protein
MSVYDSRHPVHYAVRAQTSDQTNLSSRLMCFFIDGGRGDVGEFSLFTVQLISVFSVFINLYDLEK